MRLCAAARLHAVPKEQPSTASAAETRTRCFILDHPAATLNVQPTECIPNPSLLSEPAGQSPIRSESTSADPPRDFQTHCSQTQATVDFPNKGRRQCPYRLAPGFRWFSAFSTLREKIHGVHPLRFGSLRPRLSASTAAAPGRRLDLRSEVERVGPSPKIDERPGSGSVPVVVRGIDRLSHRIGSRIERSKASS